MIRGCIQKIPDWVDKKIYAYNNKHSLRSNTKCYGGKTHKTDSQNSDTTALSGRELYHLQFSLQEASSETSGYILLLILCTSYFITIYKTNMADLRTSRVGEVVASLNKNWLKCCVVKDLWKIYKFLLKDYFTEFKVTTWRPREISIQLSVCWQ
jgi:hypothetical protein